ncbi:MAG: 30S ribosomal protein S6 [Clostridiales bacterium]|jgi:small subunit ribosomal protein S6|nr:30S ribosomal protein S6 [Clostridiales bacterium]
MAKKQANYELMYIIDATLSEEDIKALVERFKTLIEANGTLNEMEEIGKRRLAYLINDMPEGYYVLVKFTSSPEFPTELNRVLGITEGIMRSLVTVIKD